MIHSLKLAGAGAVALLLATPALSQTAWNTGTWDLDADGLLTRDEFTQGFIERMNLVNWDSDGDGLLSTDEFDSGVYDRYDRNLDGRIDATEYGMMDRGFGMTGLWGQRGVMTPGGAVGDGIVGNGVVGDGAMVDGAMGNRVMGNGVVGDGMAADGMAGGGLVGDGVVADDEAVLGTGTTGALAGWDVDGDGILLRDEFATGLTNWGTFAEFDANADNGVSLEELAAGIFNRYDDDLNGVIEEPELTDIGDDMGDGGFWDA